MKPLQIITFIGIAAIDLYMVVNDLPRQWTKPLLMLSLLGFSLFQLRGKIKEHVLFLVGQCCALLGDVFLLGNGNHYFICGLASFLLMQLIYSYVFYKQKAIGIHKQRFAVGVIILIGCLFFAVLLPHTGDLKLPVIVYNLSILAMAIFAILRWKVKGYYLVVLGAVLFIASDAALGYNKFVNPVMFAGFIIMFTYAAAQLCIVHGYLSPITSEEK